MSEMKSFRDILREKIGRSPEEKSSKSQVREFSEAPVSPLKTPVSEPFRLRLFTFKRAAPPALPVEKPKAPKNLSPSENEAFDLFVASGARGPFLSSATLLKRAFRRLARTVHPDSKPGATAFEQALLSRKFQSLLGAYNTLNTYLVHSKPKAA